MTIRNLISRLVLQEDLNFLLTNRVPRQLLTRFMGWFSQIEQPLIRDLSIATWKMFADLDLSDARKTEFRSLHGCFTRQLKDGARPINSDPKVVSSPCDGIVGACGPIAGRRIEKHLRQEKILVRGAKQPVIREVIETEAGSRW